MSPSKFVTWPTWPVCLAALAGCSSSSASGAKPTHDAGPSVTEAGVEAGVDAGADALSQPDAMPASCTYARGAMAADTLGPAALVGDAIPITNIVVVMEENHSFDDYFSHLNEYANRTDIESEPANASNPDATGQPQPVAHAPHLCTLDTDHSWAATHNEIDHGKMDGFFIANDGFNKSALPPSSTDPTLWSGARSLFWYDQTDLPYYYKLASTFAIADHYHAAVPGPTWPNRLYLYAATSFGETQNTIFPDLSAYPFPGNNPASILEELETAHVSWMMFSDSSLNSLNILYGSTDANARFGRTVSGSTQDFMTAAQAGNLPSVSFVDPNLLSEFSNGAGLDEHPPGDIQSGEQFVDSVVRALMGSPQWAHSALFLTWDEHGGFYDHVPPPSACKPDMTAPILASGDTTAGGFDMEGVRVGMVVVSPYAKAAYVGHRQYDHTSITRFIEAKFGLPALTARDANAEPPTDMFDFSTPAFATPPQIPAATVDPAGLTYCTNTYGGM